MFITTMKSQPNKQNNSLHSTLTFRFRKSPANLKREHPAFKLHLKKPDFCFDDPSQTLLGPTESQRKRPSQASLKFTDQKDDYLDELLPEKKEVNPAEARSLKRG
jgi:hypothetical protein